MQGNLLVTPEKLTSTAQEFSGKASEVQSTTNQMLDLIKTLTSSSWTGEASAAYMKQFSQLEDDMSRLYKMIMEHSTDLEEMAKNYANAESTNQNTATSLPGDVIS